MEKIQHTQLSLKIKSVIEKSPEQRISFYQFMNMALYEPELGYYTKDKTKIGKQADFYTSSSVHPVFGITVGNGFSELLPYTSEDRYYILEIGGGNGRFARDLLNNYKLNKQEQYDKLTYFMLETSPYHQALQLEYVKEHVEHVKWISSFKELPTPFNGIVFSNELVDAFPVHKVKKVAGEMKEVYVIWDEEEGTFAETIDILNDQRLNHYFTEQGITLKEGQIAEVNLDAVDWLLAVSQILNKGYLITIDYGFDAEELFASHRHEGSLMCYYQHVANDNPFQHVGEQDITSHVNFTALMEYGKQFGLENVLFTTQSRFLLNNGILNYLTEIDPISIKEKDIVKDEDLKRNRAIRHLVTPGEMGETFKVLVQQKNVGQHQYRFLQDIWKQNGM